MLGNALKASQTYRFLVRMTKVSSAVQVIGSIFVRVEPTSARRIDIT